LFLPLFAARRDQIDPPDRALLEFAETLSMFDNTLRHWVEKPLQAIANPLEKAGITATQVTLVGFFLGLLGAVAVACGWMVLGFLGVLLNRLADGVDGALARRQGPTAFGGYLDSVLDFIFYAAIPIGFAVSQPESHALPAAVLLGSFLANGGAFFAFAALQGQMRPTPEGKTETLSSREAWRTQKALPYIVGLAEGGETVLMFLLFCLFPRFFPELAYGFAALCFVSAIARIFSVAARS